MILRYSLLVISFACKLNFRCATIDICTKGVQIIFVQCSTCIRPIPWHTCCFLNKNYFQIFFANIDCRSTESLFATKLSQYTRKISQIMNILKIFSNIIPILRIGHESQSCFFWTTLYAAENAMRYKVNRTLYLSVYACDLWKPDYIWKWPKYVIKCINYHK